MQNIILIGHKSSGKTTIGLTLANNLEFDFVDTDTLILNTYCPGKTIAAFYQEIGEKRFRQLENNIIQSLPKTHTVIATGGGTLTIASNAKYLKKLGQIIYLYLPISILTERNQYREQQGILATLLDPQVHYESRDKLYRQYADFIIECKHKTVVEIINEMRKTLLK
ncbi:MAG: hypothetical protein A3E87_08565 [Gammaproteobacteria bacterium RIFCSPHIGHO2_12_FULL_35_23]|nr:MAG: hypothetical protein A3E87_08565 [Gammaproteobacteria bacterium RIFCSPHIGHO2_12_FULL_35_23]